MSSSLAADVSARPPTYGVPIDSDPSPRRWMLSLSIRARNSVSRARIESSAAVLDLGLEGLLRLRNVGRGTAAEILAAAQRAERVRAGAQPGGIPELRAERAHERLVGRLYAACEGIRTLPLAASAFEHLSTRDIQTRAGFAVFDLAAAGGHFQGEIAEMARFIQLQVAEELGILDIAGSFSGHAARQLEDGLLAAEARIEESAGWPMLVQRMRDALGDGQLRPQVPLPEWFVRGGLRVGSLTVDAKPATSASAVAARLSRTPWPPSLADELKLLLIRLRPRDLHVLRQRFSLRRPHPLRRVGAEMGITAERARQLQTRAAYRVRHEAAMIWTPALGTAILDADDAWPTGGVAGAIAAVASRYGPSAANLFDDLMMVWQVRDWPEPFQAEFRYRVERDSKAQL